MTLDKSKTSDKPLKAKKSPNRERFLEELAKSNIDNAAETGRLLGAVSMRLGTLGIGGSGGSPNVEYQLRNGSTVAFNGRSMKPREDRSSFASHNLTPLIPIT